MAFTNAISVNLIGNRRRACLRGFLGSFLLHDTTVAHGFHSGIVQLAYLTVGQVLTCFVLFLHLLSHLSALGAFFGLQTHLDQLLNIQVDVIRSMALFTRIFEYFDLEPDVLNPKDGYQPEEVKGDVAFNDVAFSYTAEKELLRQISFRADAGKTIAIVGALVAVCADYLLTPANILLYNLVWLVPGLLITEWTRAV